jgi:bacterioferritin
MAFKDELVSMLNEALELEHQAMIQYLAQAELVGGLNAEPIIERLKEIADDERKHAEMFREIIGAYLGSEPSMGMAPTHPAKTIQEILEVNLADEKEAVDTYSRILEKVRANKDELQYEYFQIEHTLRHVIQDEQEHISELKTLMDI